MKLKICFALILLWSIPGFLIAQDYFEDASGSGYTILTSSSNNFNNNSISILSTRVNVGDNSIKINFYQQGLNYKLYWLKKDSITGKKTKVFLIRKNTNLNLSPVKKIPNNKYIQDWGYGLYLKGKTEDGLGTFFSNGQFTPGFSTNAYVSYRKLSIVTVPDTLSTTLLVLLFGGYTVSNYQLIVPLNAANNQLSDTTFNGFNAGISFVYLTPCGKGNKDNWFLGASIDFNKTNNYSSLDKVEVKNVSEEKDSLGNVIRTITTINENGYLYGKGKYVEYFKTQVRFNVSYIPDFLEHMVAFLVYPSINISGTFKPQYGIGAGFQILKKGSPSISQGGIYIQLTDISNSLGSNKGFVERSLTIGLTASLNIFTQKPQPPSK